VARRTTVVVRIEAQHAEIKGGSGVPGVALYKRMLVTIDGTNGSAAVVPYAAEMALRLGCAVDVLLVEPVDGARLPHPDHHRTAVDNPAAVGENENGVKTAIGTRTPMHVREANERYVRNHVEEFEALGVAATGRVVWGDPAETILAAALELRADVIAMASRKMSQYAQRETGSVSEEVLWRSRLPVLLIAAG
jgi:nucleotide-binding universal stress UspA family protein